MSKVLLVLNHPNYKDSFANKIVVEKLKSLIPDIEIDHIDTNGLNNHVENLRWVTHQNNMNNEITADHIKHCGMEKASPSIPEGG